MSRKITLENGQTITISEESYKELSKSTQKIMVPYSIKLAPFSGGQFAIEFGDNQWLDYDPTQGTWQVQTSLYSCGGRAKQLVPVHISDLVPGRVYVQSGSNTPQCLEDVDEYLLYIGDGKFVYTWDGEIRACELNYGNWWEVRLV